MEHLDKICEDAKAALELAKQAAKRQYDKHKANAIDYQPGDLVWLDAKNIRTTRTSAKLDVLWHGLFIVKEKVGTAAYQLQLPDHPSWRRKHDVFNERLLKPYIQPISEHQKNTSRQPGPIEVNEKAEYEVEAILDTRKRGRTIEYLVKWEGYPHSDNTWEPRMNVGHAAELITEFHNDNPLKPKPNHSIKGLVLTMTPEIKGSLHPVT